MPKFQKKPATTRIFAAAKAFKEEVGHENYLALRHKCQTDLWFLAKDVLGMDLFETTHRPVVNFFLKKKPFDISKENYTLNDVHEAIKTLSLQRRGILLYPRGSYKTTIDKADIIQYILCFPDIRVLILVGESSLGEGFVPSIKRYFILEPRLEPTTFQKLFPEFVIDIECDENKGGELEYWCPARKLIHQVEPTLGSLSVLGATSGWHCDVLKADDVITDTNSLSEANREKVKTKFNNVVNLLDPHGILELIGTRYHKEDLYAHARKTLKNPRYLCAASWIVLPHAKHKKRVDLIDSDVVLLFPERQGFEYLHEKLLSDEETFCCQQLNDPIGSGPTVIFKLEDLQKATRRLDSPSPKDRRFNFWDTAGSNRQSADFSVGIFLTINELFQAFVHHIIVDKFTPAELALQVAKLAKQTQPERVLAEKWVGNEAWFDKEVTQQAVAMGYQIPLEMFKTDKSANAKANRISGLEPLIKNDRLYFSNLIPNLDLVYKQFVDFTGERNGKKHDDIPDAISFVLRVLPFAGLELPSPAKPQVPLDNSASNAAWAAARRPDDLFKAAMRNDSFVFEAPTTSETRIINPYSHVKTTSSPY